MRTVATIISFCLALFLLSSGCSKEEETSVPEQRNRVVKPIKSPVQKKEEISSMTQEPKPESEQKEVMEDKPPAVEEVPLIVEEKPAKRVAAAEEKALKGPEAVEEKVLKGPEAVKEKVLKPPEKEAKKKETPKVNGAGYYVVKKGDSLYNIAAREEVYGDRLNWPILYRLNMDKFDKIGSGEDFPKRNLTVGIRLKIVTPQEAKETLKKRAKNPWVINVLSATAMEQVNPTAIKLIKNGYLVYITRAKVKGKDWIRLRVGFFKDKAEADAEGKKIMGILNRADSWINKIGKRELAKFSGY